MATLYPIITDTNKIVVDWRVMSGDTHKVWLLGGDYGSNIIINGGGDNTTDWVDTNADGLANNWDQYNFSAKGINDPPIYGFTTRSQFVSTVGSGVYNAWLYQTNIGVSSTNGKTYHVWFEYRTQTQVLLEIVSTGGISQSIGIIYPNTGTAAELEFEFVCTISDINEIQFIMMPSEENYLMLAKVNMKEVT